MSEYKKKLQVKDLSEPKLQDVVVSKTGFEFTIDLNIKWEDFRKFSQDVSASRDKNGKIVVDELGSSISMICKMITKWNVYDKEEMLSITPDNFKRIGTPNIIASIGYVEKNSGMGAEAKKKGKD